MADVAVPLVDGTTELFRNEDGSGWMLAGDHANWIWNMREEGPIGDRGKYRDRGRRHKPGYNVKAAVLITGGSRGDADAQATLAWEDASADWRKKNGVGRWVDQWKKHFMVQHQIGVFALSFIPYVGPMASAVANSQTPAVAAAVQRRIAEREKGKVEDKYREDYLKALDAYMNGDEDALDVGYLEYRATVIIPAAWDVKNQLMAGTLDLDGGRVWLGEDGMFRWENGQIVDADALLTSTLTGSGYGGILGWVLVPLKRILVEAKARPSMAAISLVAGLAGGALAFKLLGSEGRN